LPDTGKPVSFPVISVTRQNQENIPVCRIQANSTSYFLPDFVPITGKFASLPGLKRGLAGLSSRLPAKYPTFLDYGYVDGYIDG